MRYYLLLIGIPIAGYGLRLLYQQVAFLSRSRKVRGELSGWKQSGYHWYPEVSYTAHNGLQYRVVGTAGIRPKPNCPLGRSFAVRYHEQAPDQAKVSTFLQLWGAPLAFLVLGGAALLAFAKGPAHKSQKRDGKAAERVAKSASIGANGYEAAR